MGDILNFSPCSKSSLGSYHCMYVHVSDKWLHNTVRGPAYSGTSNPDTLGAEESVLISEVS